jgi:hypothetical protein
MLLEQTKQAPDASARAIFELRFHRIVALALETDRGIYLVEARLRRGIAVENVVLASL